MELSDDGTGIKNEFEFGKKTILDLQDAEQDLNDAELRYILAHTSSLLVLMNFRRQ